MTGLRVGAFGWGTHTPRSSNAAREAKVRPCVVLFQNGPFFVVVFGRSEPFLDHLRVSVGTESVLGKRLGLTTATYFQGDIAIAPPDFDARGFFAIEPEDLSSPEAVHDDDQWISLRGLAERR